MTYSINWTTKVITIPKTDLNFVSSGVRDKYELSVDDFRLAIRLIEDDVIAMPFKQIVSNIPPSSLGGTVFARVVTLINGYTVTFEDGAYSVDLTDGNSNIADNTNPNNVGVNSANSAGLIEGSGGGSGTITPGDIADIVEGVWSDNDQYGTGEKGNDVKKILGLTAGNS